ncbi:MULTISPECIES: Lrp/AsnC family transcriptional regulator [unclassified Moritella]|uniref:Lrp/AsnC family transcriptional regulator n=1 Tax=unclassified Moritella TaxID=2637987 RepID=UPI001BAC141F|nr:MULTISPECIES: Lrp/AsnC family transcriptional regulator [unclassified Moritella]QUM82544.1 Lrp/AsnC family transcriptional regulator [Moritella sp. 5]QUM86849.1 Lrp/AsnC family transcriptional regulator [Moritella sp. 28]
MLDSKDKLILDILQRDASLSVAELADKVSLTVSPCWKRLKRLEDSGYILRRVALLNEQKLGLALTAFVNIKTQNHSDTWFKKFVVSVDGFAEVTEFYRMAGEYDYMMKVLVKDMAAFDVFYKRLVNCVDGLTDVTSSFAMEGLKNTTQLPIS